MALFEGERNIIRSIIKGCLVEQQAGWRTPASITDGLNARTARLLARLEMPALAEAPPQPEAALPPPLRHRIYM